MGARSTDMKEKLIATDGKQKAALPAPENLPAVRGSTDLVDTRDRGAILIIDDDPRHAEATAEALALVGYRCTIAVTGNEGLQMMKRRQFDLVLTDLVMADVGGIDIVRKAQELNPFAAVMVVTGHGSIETAVEAMKKGAVDYITKPLNIDALRIKVGKVLEIQELRRTAQSQKRQLGEKFTFAGVIGSSEKMRRVVEVCAQIAPTDVGVLITGETGTGKELVAHAIHANSLRKDRRFVPMNCAALSPQLIESELFGHEKGSFTGANYQRKGYFEHAHRGTLFLDEVGDIPAETQIKLLRTLESREVTRIGANDPIAVDVRVISATNRDLEALVRQNLFREDLYYRLKVVTIHLPPLRERPQDIPVLVHHFIGEYATAHGKPVTDITPEALAYLVQYPWKGNIRELKHVMENMVVMSPGSVLGVENLPENIYRAEPKGTGTTLSTLSGIPIRDVERELIKNTLAQLGGNRQATAKVLKIGERTLYRKLKRYHLH
jgi:two-component system response regulator HydG